MSHPIWRLAARNAKPALLRAEQRRRGKRQACLRSSWMNYPRAAHRKWWTSPSWDNIMWTTLFVKKWYCNFTIKLHVFTKICFGHFDVIAPQYIDTISQDLLRTCLAKREAKLQKGLARFEAAQNLTQLQDALLVLTRPILGVGLETLSFCVTNCSYRYLSFLTTGWSPSWSPWWLTWEATASQSIPSTPRVSWMGLVNCPSSWIDSCSSTSRFDASMIKYV